MFPNHHYDEKFERRKMFMKKFVVFIALLFAGIVVMATGVAQAETATPQVKIFDIMACNVYVDFDNSYVPTKIKRQQHKFLVAFYPTPGVPTPELIDTITAYGPDGYKVDFAVNQKHDAKNKNGYIYDRTTDGYWYMVNLDSGFMKEGEYKIEVKCKNGDIVSASRIQKNAPSDEMVAAYLKNKKKLNNSYFPSKTKKLKPGTPLTNVKVTWATKEMAHLYAYYIFRLSEGKKISDFDTQNLVWWDNIFRQRLTGRTIAGLERGEVTIDAELKPKTGYVYFVEMTDSNKMGDTNICIFQPHQIFVTP
jgi:hypothetical protein